MIHLSKIILFSSLATFALNSSALAKEGVTIPKPTPQQLAWQQAELGVLVSYDLHVFDDKHYKQDENRRNAIQDANIFNPTEFDTDQWLKVARSMGARFAIRKISVAVLP